MGLAASCAVTDHRSSPYLPPKLLPSAQRSSASLVSQLGDGPSTISSFTLPPPPCLAIPQQSSSALPFRESTFAPSRPKISLLAPLLRLNCWLRPISFPLPLLPMPMNTRQTAADVAIGYQRQLCQQPFVVPSSDTQTRHIPRR